MLVQYNNNDCKFEVQLNSYNPNQQYSIKNEINNFELPFIIALYG